MIPPNLEETKVLILTDMEQMRLQILRLEQVAAQMQEAILTLSRANVELNHLLTTGQVK